MHDVKVTFFITEISSRKIINHHFRVNNNKGKTGIVYDMIIGRDMMVKLGLTADFKRQFLQRDFNTVHTKEPSGLIGKSDLNKCDMREVVMQTAEPAST